MLNDSEYMQMRQAFEQLPPPEFVLRAQAAAAAHGDDARLWFLLGAGHHRLGAIGDALAAFERTLELQPGNVQAINARAAMLAALGHLPEARALLEEARRLFPEDASVLVNLGYLLEQQGEAEEALRCYDAALALDASNQAALMNRGYLLTLLERLPEAVENNRRLVAHHSGLAVAHFNLAEALLACLRTDEALHASDEALALDPSHANACMVRGLALAELGRLEEAQQAIDRACVLDPEVISRATGAFEPNRTMPPPAPDAQAVFLHRGFKHLLACDWKHRDFFLREFETRMRGSLAAGEPVRDYSFAYDLVSTPIDPLLHRQVMQALAAQFGAKARSQLPAPYVHAALRGARLKIGYVSPDFREHLNARLTLPIFRLHDRSRFDVHCYSLHADDGSEIRRRVAGAADRFVDVSGRTAAQVAQAIHADGIDILVDLAGVTAHSQPDVFAFRPAPVQVSYLGFPGTLGATYIPWRITDRVASPLAQRAYWTESLVYLPDTFYIYDVDEPLVPQDVSRAEYGLPEDGFVFYAFHNYYKIDPPIFAAWMRVLRRVPGSVLWLAGRDRIAVENLRHEAVAAGVPPERLQFAPVESRERYRARQRLADLYLDVHRFNAMTTACDALWTGLPMITFPGEAFATRVGASLLQAVGLEDCVMPSLQAYEDEAVRLATDRRALAGLRARLARERLIRPLFDTPGRVRELEGAFEGIWERHRSGRAPEDFDVARAAPVWRNPWH